MRPTFANRIAPLLLGAAALSVSAPLCAQSGAFSLPPNPSPTATGNPDVQGPVDPDQPILTRPRSAAPRPAPTPREPAAVTPVAPPTTAATRSPAPRPTATAGPTPSRTAPRSAPQPSASDGPPPLPASTPAVVEAAPPPALRTGLPAPTVSASTAVPPAEEGGFPWLWVLAGLAGTVAVAAGFFAYRRRQEEWTEPATIEPPLARKPTPRAADAPGEAPFAPVVPLMIEAQALKLSRSMMFATLSYELRLANRGPAALTDIRLGGDLVTAHGRVPVDQQLADPAVPLELIQRVDELAAGDSKLLSGEIRLPVGQIRVIQQGSAILYVPLLRLRIEAEGLAPFARTFVVGMRPAAPGGKLQPFRLDDMPQTYRQIAQRALD